MDASQDKWKLARQQSDGLADRAIASYFEDRPRAEWKAAWQAVERNGDRNPSSLPKPFADYLQELEVWPSWANPALFEEGQCVFGCYAMEILSMLGLYSLPYCYAGADGAKVLYASEQIRTNPGQRLLDTADFVMAVMDPKGWSPEGKGIRALQKVRLLHASIRYHLLKQGWDSAAHGVPINQTDMAGTNMAFGWIALRGLWKLRLSLTRDQMVAYLHTWKVLGYWMGVDEAYLSDDPDVLRKWDEEIATTQFRASKEGRTLTHALLKYMKQESPIPGFSLLSERIMGNLLGAGVAPMLGLQAQNMPTGVLPLFFAPLQLAHLPRRDSRKGYHQAKLALAQQKQRMNQRVTHAKFEPALKV